jgi:predicted DCC family thiol-disulfide oxidoreductase YuxK
MSKKLPPGLKVYYNSACPVCKAGIDSQRGKMQDETVDWKDVHCDLAAREEVDADLEFVRERLHVVDAQGQVHVGMRAFAAIWAHSPGEAWKARLVNLPVIKQLSDWGYNAFARVLYRWNRSKAHW